MRGILLSLCFIVTALIARSQSNGSVKGRLIDSTTTQSLQEATVSVLKSKDSSLVTFTLTDKHGGFEIKNLDTGSYYLIITHTGFEIFLRPFIISTEAKDVELGEMILQKEFKTLPGVVVTDAAPVRIKDDTISFKADAFKTKPNASVEDLLKKLPGVQVQKDGTVSAMGENVQKVYVDGKEFFGNDPKLATKNLTADMVEQVQVFDDMSEQSKFTKIDDGSRSKTINIKLKKDKNKGDFGKISVGAGSEKRYEGNLSYNHFRGDQRISVLGAANNTNKQGFSFSDIITSMGGMSAITRSAGGFGGSGGMGGMGGAMSIPFSGGSGFGGGGSGITKSVSGGFNFNDEWRKIDFRSSYYYTNTDNRLIQNSYRQSFFPGDSTTEAFTEMDSRNKNRNHRFNARWEYAVDSLNSFLYNANLNFQRSDGLYYDSASTYSHALSDYLAITSRNYDKNHRDGNNYSGELLYRRKFRKAGRTLTLGWRNGFNESESDGSNISPFIFYKPDGDTLSARNQDYVSGHATRNNSNTLSTSYTEPIAANRLIEINYAYSHNKSTSDKRTFDYNSNSGKYDMVNLFLTNYFENSNTSNRVGANFREQQKKYNFQVGSAIQFTELRSRSLQASTGKDTVISQRFTNFFPSASFNYIFSRAKNLRFYYRGRTNAPSVTQLQDVPDISNPLQVRMGNPSLKQEFNHNFNFNYHTFNILTFRFFAANLNVNATGNKIVNSIDSISKSVTITRPVNMGGSFGTTAFFTIGMPIKKLKGSNLNFSTIGSFNRDVSLLYKEKNFTNRIVLTQSFSFNYNYKEKLDMGISGNLSYNGARYSLQEALNTSYFSQTYSTDISYTYKDDIIIATDFDYYLTTGRTEGYNQDIPIWNLYLSKQLFKNNAGELKFSLFDVLKQNKSTNRSVGDNYFEDLRSNVIGRYFLISFTYTLNKMTGQQLPGGIQRMIERGTRIFRPGH